MIGRQHLAAWKEIGAPERVLEWIESGYPIPWRDGQAPAAQPAPPDNPTLSAKESAFVDEEVSQLLRLGAIERTTPEQVRYLSPLKVTPKKNNKLRLVLNLWRLNEHVAAPKFRYESMKELQQIVQPGDYMFTIDLKNGFHHVPVHPDSRPFLAFRWKGNFYRYKVLPFGLSASPYCFTKVLRPVVRYIRAVLQARCSNYVDDWLFMRTSQEATAILKSTTLKLFSRLGLTINFTKSDLDISQQQTYVGYDIDTSGRTPKLKVPRKKRRDIERQIRHFLSKAHTNPFRLVPARMAARLAGVCTAVTNAVVPGRLMLRALYKDLHQASRWDDDVCLSKKATRDLLQFAQHLHAWNGRALLPPTTDLVLYTDASDKGWGATMSGQTARGTWRRPELSHINQKELAAVVLSIRSFARVLSLHSRSILLRTDNITTVCYVNNFGGRVPQLTSLREQLWELEENEQLSIHAEYISGRNNTVADHLSRTHDRGDWSLTDRVFHAIDQQFGPHHVDRFASYQNKKLRRYNSRWADPSAEAVNALTQEWKGTHSFVNAPFRLLPEVLRLIAAQRVTATVIAPFWPAQPWFQTLRRLTVARPMLIPNIPQSFQRGPSGVIPEPAHNRKWTIAAWPVSGQNA